MVTTRKGAIAERGGACFECGTKKDVNMYYNKSGNKLDILCPDCFSKLNCRKQGVYSG